ncbi:hypothetical protein [Streptomyces alboflavus]|uniref:hypothetical protein n=1 Tax=Streptomyces alboflavus TaxID=67267 RepID=UPI00139686A1
MKGAPSGPASRTGSPPLGASRGDGKGPASGAPEGEAPGAALTARTRPYAFEYEDDCVESFLVDRAPDKVPARPAWQDVPAWVGELGAVSAREQFVEVTVQGTGGEPVVVTGMNVRVRSTGAPLAWNNFRIGNGCGEVVETKYFSVDLDAAARASRRGRTRTTSRTRSARATRWCSTSRAAPRSTTSAGTWKWSGPRATGTARSASTTRASRSVPVA